MKSLKDTQTEVKLEKKKQVRRSNKSRGGKTHE